MNESHREVVKNALAIDRHVATRLADVPWQRVKTIGNILRHESGDVDAAVIWRSVTGSDLSTLMAAARRELKRLGDSQT